MAARILRDKDARLSWLKNRRCGVLGFGAQGQAHAMNLRDSGMDVVVGLRPKSKSRASAKSAGLRLVDAAALTESTDVIFMAVPDTVMPAAFHKFVAPKLRAGQTLLFAHGFAIYYKTIVPSKNVDVILVAPKGLGPMVRREFVAGRGAPGLVAVHQNATGAARKTALAWAKAIGCTRAGVIETTFREETETDLFGEQAVLCGGTAALINAGFETLVEAGYTPELAYFECLHELKFIVDMIHERGIAAMRERISETAAWGDLTVGSRIIDASVKRRMQGALQAIQSGKFADGLIREIENGRRELRRKVARGRKHEIERVGRRLRGLMSWDRK